MNFNVFGLSSNIEKALADLSFISPTPVQERVIPQILNETRDIIALAQTGTGKTAAFGLPLLERVNPLSKETQILILCPTRELCMQIVRDMKGFSKYLPHFGITAVYGGASASTQIRELKQGARIIVATPGRLLDLINRGAAKLSSLRYLVLDEADEMLNMGFRDELDEILSNIPSERQTLLFSATMPAEVSRIASKYMKDPLEIAVGRKNEGVSTVEHRYYVVSARDKYEALKRLVDFYPDIYGIIFCRTRVDTKELANKLIKEGYNADALHGDLSQDQRDYVMRKFRERSLQLLLATDIAARGLDVADLTHVIHYDIPDEAEVYTHRSGRTGRIGKTGTSLAIINLRERHRIGRIERTLGKKFTEASIPTAHQICEQQLFSMIRRLRDVEVDEDSFSRFIPTLRELTTGLDREEIIKRFLTLEFSRLFAFYKDLPDITTSEIKERAKPGEQKKRKGAFIKSAKPGDYSWLTINLGRRDGINPAELISLINRSAGKKPIDLGKIDIYQTQTRFQVQAVSGDYLVSILKKKNYRGKSIQIKEDSGRKKEKAPGSRG